MADSEFFSISGFEEGIKELMNALDEIDNKAKGEICKEAVNKAADVILNEEKRILSNHPKYVKFVPLLSKNVYKSGSGYVAACGYSSEVLKENIAPLIIEFGRGSGKRAVKQGGWTKEKKPEWWEFWKKQRKSRRIGVIQPYSHIRAAWFGKKEEAQELVGNYIYDEIRKAWVKKNG